MKRLCPVCFTELPENANYCPVCGKCMREVVEQTSEYIGSSPVTTIVGINDCAIHVKDQNATSTTKLSQPIKYPQTLGFTGFAGILPV